MVPQGDAELISWVTRNSRPLYELTEAREARALLDALTVKLDGTKASAKLYRRKRPAVFNMLSFAVERGLLTDHPLARIKHKVTKALEQVDPGVVVNPRQTGEC